MNYVNELGQPKVDIIRYTNYVSPNQPLKVHINTRLPMQCDISRLKLRFPVDVMLKLWMVLCRSAVGIINVSDPQI